MQASASYFLAEESSFHPAWRNARVRKERIPFEEFLCTYGYERF